MSLKNDMKQVKLEVSQKTNQINQKVSNVEQKVDDSLQKISGLEASIQQILQQTEPEPLLPHEEVAKKSKSMFMSKWNDWNSLMARRIKVIAGGSLAVVFLFFASSGFIMDYINNAKDFLPTTEEATVETSKKEKSEVPEDIQVHLNAIMEYTETISKENNSLKESHKDLQQEHSSLKKENELLKKENKRLRGQIEQADDTAK